MATYTGSDKRLQYLFTHGGGGGGGADIWVGTLAEYTQQAAQIADGTTVLITDDEDNYITEYHVYSTEERVVGQWVDGSTLYERTIHGSWTVSGVDYQVVVETLASNINLKRMIDGGIWRGGLLFCPTIYAPQDIYYRYVYTPSTNEIGLRVGQSNGTSIEVYLTIQYTKTS